MLALTSQQRRELRAKAHHLSPSVHIGHHGLTPAVQHEIDLALLAHDLVKVKVTHDVRAEREALLEAVCAALDCAPVQHLGKVLVLWRPNPERKVARPPAAAKAARKPGARKPGGKAPRGTATAGGKGAGGSTRRRPTAPTGDAADAPKARSPRGQSSFDATVERRRAGGTGKPGYGPRTGTAPKGGYQGRDGDSARRGSRDPATGGRDSYETKGVKSTRKGTATTARTGAGKSAAGSGERRRAGGNAAKEPASNSALPYFSRRGAGRFVTNTPADGAPPAKPAVRRRPRSGS